MGRERERKGQAGLGRGRERQVGMGRGREREVRHEHEQIKGMNEEINALHLNRKKCTSPLSDNPAKSKSQYLYVQSINRKFPTRARAPACNIS